MAEALAHHDCGVELAWFRLIIANIGLDIMRAAIQFLSGSNCFIGAVHPDHRIAARGKGAGMPTHPAANIQDCAESRPGRAIANEFHFAICAHLVDSEVEEIEPERRVAIRFWLVTRHWSLILYS